LNWSRAELRKKQKPEAKREFIHIKFQYFFMVKITIKPKDKEHTGNNFPNILLVGGHYDSIY
jgi:hypothetical protein